MGGAGVSTPGERGPGIHVRMRARSTTEPHRASSPLELLYDLIFVVAVGSLVAQLVEAIEAGRAASAILPFLFVFFAIWWAWINFTWFASAYDTDDVVYRLLIVVQMAGVLVLAAGVPAGFHDVNFVGLTIGYVIMRVGQIGLWTRAAVEYPATRATSLRYVVAVGLIQVGWVARLWLPGEVLVLGAGLALGVLEALTPPWAQRAGDLAWHPRHIAERYGLFVIILLGESVLAAVNGLQGALAASGVSLSLVVISLAALILLVGLWWAYFLQDAGTGLQRRRGFSFVWGYGHYFLFVAFAALGAGLEAAVRASVHPHQVDALTAGMFVAVPAALAVFLIWALHAPLLKRPGFPGRVAVPASVLILIAGADAPLIGVSTAVVGIAVVVAIAVAVSVAVSARRRPAAPSP